MTLQPGDSTIYGWRPARSGPSLLNRHQFWYLVRVNKWPDIFSKSLLIATIDNPTYPVLQRIPLHVVLWYHIFTKPRELQSLEDWCLLKKWETLSKPFHSSSVPQNRPLGKIARRIHRGSIFSSDILQIHGIKSPTKNIL